MDLISILGSVIGFCDQLAAIHQRDEYHGNLSDDNICTDGGGELAAPDINHLPSLSQYTSPEQTGRINRQVDYRTDFYSLGIFLYAKVTGHLPFSCADDFELIHAIVAREPVSPLILNPDIPLLVSEIIMKLLSKNPEDRYQSVHGFKYDLERCLVILDDTKDPSQLHFPLGEHDFSGRFEISQKIVGREKETELLLNAIDRIADRPAELILITGYPGIGKTSLVNQVRNKLLEKRGYFISGKYELYKRNIPYSALIQAFSGLIALLLRESTASLDTWRSMLQIALTVNGKVMTDVIPDLELIIGKQPDVNELGPNETQHRFHFVFERFIEVFTRKEHPLVIFLDDLQWIDQATLGMLEMLATKPDNNYLLILGAYRDNEVDQHHPLMQVIKKIETKSGSIHSILLKPLNESDMTEIITSTLKCAEYEAKPLAMLCLRKTEGNPFYFKQFLISLYHTRIIAFDARTNEWVWNLQEIESMDLTDNIADFMIRKINDLPADIKDLLMHAAAAGNQFSVGLLMESTGMKRDEIRKLLRWATTENIVIPNPDDKLDIFRFSHDEIQKAIYSLIPGTEIRTFHLRIGMHFLRQKSGMAEEECLFEIVSHLNLASELIIKPDERLQLAQLNLRAGIKAKRSAAYCDAMIFFNASKDLLPKDSWGTHYPLTFNVFYSLIESSLLLGDLNGMDSFIEQTYEHLDNIIDRIKINHIRILSCYSVNNPAEAVRLSFEALKMLGIVYPAAVTPDDIQSALLGIEELLKEKNIDDLLDLPYMDDREKIETLGIISSLFHGVYFVAPMYFPLLAATCVEFSVKYGNAPHSIPGYAVYGLVLCAMVNDIEKGYRFGLLAMRLLEKTGFREFTAQTTVIFYNLIAHWKQHVNTGIPFLKAAHQTGMETGDIPYAVDCVHGYCYYSFFAGKSLGFLCDELGYYESKLKMLRQENSLHYMLLQIYHQSFENLISKDQDQDMLFGTKFNEEQISVIDLQTRGMTALFVFYAFKSFLALLFEEYGDTLEYIRKGQENMAGATSTYHIPFFKFTETITMLALVENEHDPKYGEFGERIRANRSAFKTWAEKAPVNHEHNLLLIDAEMARVKGENTGAIDLYDAAIRLAQQNKFIYHEAIANERAARFWLTLKNEKFAHLYLTEAYRCYKAWGAKAKLQDLEKKHAGLLISDRFKAVSFDESAIIKVSQALSVEIRLAELLKKLMTLAIEYAGAERGFLILRQKGDLFIEAEVNAKNAEVRVQESVAISSSDKLSQGIVNFVNRTRQNIVLGNASADSDFKTDKYISINNVKSLLCQPMLSQGHLIGLLYLENNLLPHAFSEERLEVLKIIVSQAVISIENAMLVNNLEQIVSERTAELAAINEKLVNANQELVKAKEIAEESEKLFNTLLEHSPIYIFVKDSEFNAVRLSPNFSDLIGKPLNEMIGKSMKEIYPHDLADQILEDDKMVLKAGKPLEFEEAMNNRFYSTIKFPIQVEGKPPYLAGFTIDITGRKQAELRIQMQNKELLELNATKDKFFSIVSHDLRSPFNSLLGFSELLLENLNEFDKEIIGEQLSIIHRISSRTYKLLEDILTWANLQTGKLPFKPEKLLFYETCNEIIANFVESANSKKIRIRCNEINGHLILNADLNMYKTVMRNLLSNAIKFTNAGGEIAISSKVDKGNAIITVSDNGVGIITDDIPKLWDITTSFSKPGTLNEKGTGIGLTLCKEFVERHGGRIWVESQPGKGSDFSFSLPLSDQ